MTKTAAGAAGTGGASAESLRLHNLSLLARAVVLSPEPLSRAELALSSGLNRSTVTRLIDSLISYGIVVERGTRHAGNGRPSVPLHAAPHTHVAVGVEISAEAIVVQLIDLTGEVLAQTFRGVSGAADPESVWAYLGPAIQKMSERASASGLQIVGCTIGIPGLIDKPAGKVLIAPNLGWRDVPFTLTPAHLGLPHVERVQLANAATLSARAEWVARVRQEAMLSEFIYVTGSTGIGSAVVRADHIDDGPRGWGGELGHVWAAETREPCSCGSTGCLELFAGRAALMRQTGLDEHDSWGALLAAVHRRDRAARQAVESAGVMLGRALAGYVNLVDAPTVVLGGLLGQLYDDLAPWLCAELQSRVLAAPWLDVRIERGLVDEAAVAVGAAWQGLTDFLDMPQRWRAPHEDMLAYRQVKETPEVILSDC
ncbi:MAG: ROK family protein [Propionibacteriaceae bacterium]